MAAGAHTHTHDVADHIYDAAQDAREDASGGQELVLPPRGATATATPTPTPRDTDMTREQLHLLAHLPDLSSTTSLKVS